MVTLFNVSMSEEKLAKIARISTDGKRKRTDDDLLRHLMNKGHLSVFEHAHMTVYVECMIMVVRHIMRHRTFSFTEKSGRYSMFKAQDFDFSKFHNAHRIYMTLGNMMDIYMEEVANGTPKEDARKILPLMTGTKLYITGDLRNWMHFFDLRLTEHAQQETREVAEMIYSYFQSEFPVIGEAYERGLR